MKRTFVLLAAALMLAGSYAVADEATLIDFGQLDADILPDAAGVPQENSRTVMDYSLSASPSLTDEQKAQLKSSLALKNWEVHLNASAREPYALINSGVKAAPVRAEATVPFAGQNIMGVRISFPTPAVTANARIVPPFEIPANEPLAAAGEDGVRGEPTDEEKASGLSLFEGTPAQPAFGVIKNVGTLKAISVTVMGNNYPHKLFVLLKDNDGVERRYLMGDLQFDGWKELRWDNSAYIANVRDRELRMESVYPRGLPYVKFIGFQIAKDGSSEGGDFIGYFKDVKILYDKAVLETERDIADEDIWGIITKREADKQAAELRGFGSKQVKMYVENQKKAQESGFTSTLNPPEN